MKKVASVNSNSVLFCSVRANCVLKTFSETAYILIDKDCIRTTQARCVCGLFAFQRNFYRFCERDYIITGENTMSMFPSQDNPLSMIVVAIALFL